MVKDNINIFFEDVAHFQLDENAVYTILERMILHENKIVGEISIIFCSDNYLLDINKQYLNHDFYTDIVTFDYVDKNIISGDLFISIDRVKENAEKLNLSFINELFRVILHGVLHLIGYGDKTDEEKKEMRSKEDFYLSYIDFSTLSL